jgi:hypothetical protein
VMVTEVSCGSFPMHVSAACVCTVPDVDACALSPLGVEFECVAGAGAPLDKEIGSTQRAGILWMLLYGGIASGKRVVCLFRRVLEKEVIDDGAVAGLT